MTTQARTRLYRVVLRYIRTSNPHRTRLSLVLWMADRIGLFGLRHDIQEQPQSWSHLGQLSGRPESGLCFSVGTIQNFRRFRPINTLSASKSWRTIFWKLAIADSAATRPNSRRVRASAGSGNALIRGRVLLIGDAAHAFRPQLAQGAAMAIEDARRALGIAQ
jgi:hypothetical protein